MPDATELPLVSLIGAGPGGADLITVRGARLLERADVVVFDRLADPALLAYASPLAELVPVGKAKGGGMPQHEINAVLVAQARRGRRVVRLKGGDPFVFGRGAEEVDALERAGIAVEVVPGVSSALAAPALAGIPVTERGGAASVAIVSGHRADDADGEEWEALARGVDTIVVLMAATTARTIAAHLVAAGRPPDQPVAALHRAGTPAAASAVLTLAELAATGCPFPAPTVLVIGAAAARARPVGYSPSSRPNAFI